MATIAVNPLNTPPTSSGTSSFSNENTTAAGALNFSQILSGQLNSNQQGSNTQAPASVSQNAPATIHGDTKAQAAGTPPAASTLNNTSSASNAQTEANNSTAPNTAAATNTSTPQATSVADSAATITAPIAVTAPVDTTTSTASDTTQPAAALPVNTAATAGKIARLQHTAVSLTAQQQSAADASNAAANQVNGQSGNIQQATTSTTTASTASPADMTPVSRATAIAKLMDSVAGMVGTDQVSGSATNATAQNKNPTTQSPGDNTPGTDAADKQTAVATVLPTDAATLANAALQSTALNYQQTSSGKTTKTASEQAPSASLEGNSAVSSASLKAGQATQPPAGLAIPAASAPAPDKTSTQNTPTDNTAGNNSVSQATPTGRNAVMADSSSSSQSAAVQNAASIVQHMTSTATNTPGVAAATMHQTGPNAQQAEGMAALGAIVQSGQINATSEVSAASGSLRPPVGTQDWDTALSQQVAWMANSQQQTATLTLNPPDLGPMRIVLNLSDNTHQLGASFLAAHPETRAALEAAMPRLREMLDSAGIQLGQTSVGSGDTPSSNWAGNNRPQSQSHSFFTGDNNELVTGGETLISPQINQQSAGIGLIDTHV